MMHSKFMPNFSHIKSLQIPSVPSHLKVFLKNAIKIHIEGIIMDLIIIPVEHHIKHPPEKLTKS